MKIVFDGRWLGRTGIGRYAAELLDQLQELDQDNEYYVLLLPDWHEKWQPRNERFHKILTPYEVYTWQEQVLLPWQIGRLGADLVHFTSFNLPVLYPGRFVTTVHDLTLVNYKNVRGEGMARVKYELKYWLMRLVLWLAVRRAQRIIVPVEYVKDQLAQRLKVPPRKVTVTYEAVNPLLAEPGDLSRLELPERFVLYVGNYYPYKNVPRLVEAFAKTQACREGVKLVLNGKSEFFQDKVRRQVKRLGLESAVVWPGYTDDRELVALYQRAQLFVFPSLSEGFGLPGLEAMAEGTPVLAARASCLPEVYGDAAAYFDPLNTDELAEKLDALLADQRQLEKLRAAGTERVKRFSWKTMAELTMAVYRKAGRH